MQVESLEQKVGVLRCSHRQYSDRHRPGSTLTLHAELARIPEKLTVGEQSRLTVMKATRQVDVISKAEA